MDDAVKCQLAGRCCPDALMSQCASWPISSRPVITGTGKLILARNKCARALSPSHRPHRHHCDQLIRSTSEPLTADGDWSRSHGHKGPTGTETHSPLSTHHSPLSHSYLVSYCSTDQPVQASFSLSTGTRGAMGALSVSRLTFFL